MAKGRSPADDGKRFDALGVAMLINIYMGKGFGEGVGTGSLPGRAPADLCWRLF